MKLPNATFLLLLYLKLTNQITLSYWVVTAPIWGAVLLEAVFNAVTKPKVREPQKKE